MATKLMDKILLSRFKGCLVGGVVGDCIGALYEGLSHVKTNDLIERINKLEKDRQTQREHGTKPAEKYGFSYTDDTAMARSVAGSLIDKGQFDAPDMGKRFAEEYFREPDRGYGGSIAAVFDGIRDTNTTDVYQPASKQFEGSGSYGNGGAMRIAPAALFTFCDNNATKLISLVSSITRLTHTNHLAIHGAILVALAVDQSLRLPQDTAVDCDEFIEALIIKLRPLEEEHDKSSMGPPPLKKNSKRVLDASATPYCAKLKRIKEMLKEPNLKTATVVEELGTDVSALGSVPAAVLCFLKAAIQNIPKLKDHNKFSQTVLYAITLGGDTDTVATMAGAMAGALYGMEAIPESWRYYCEGVADAETMAEHFFNMTQAPTVQ
ncbi:unnamed protein product [Lymnaea stagnalis]|uniref:ADP-ribosylhydrolase ARH3 n=1 Tax=Lymnaea stagnalis TaxID=6523 RepID=A0AAV2IAW2_LYMST